jgi:hypothetical protein
MLLKLRRGIALDLYLDSYLLFIGSSLYAIGKELLEGQLSKGQPPVIIIIIISLSYYTN